MEKKGLFLIILAMILFVPKAFAFTGFYFEKEDETYGLCGNSLSECITVKKGQSGAVFNLNASQITYNNEIFYYDSSRQLEYDKTLYGKTKMFFYINANGKYVLCKTTSTCLTYSFDELSKKSAIISSSDINLNNEIYYLNSDKQTEANSTSSNSSSSTSKTASTSEVTTNDCATIKEPLKFVGNIILIAKIVIPLIIMVLGVIDFGKAVIAQKDDEIKKAAFTFGRRIAAGIAIFFIPTIVSVMFSLVSDFMKLKGDFNACQKCVLRVNECK